MDFTPSRHEQLSEDSLKWGFWWIDNRAKLRKYLAIFLVLFALGTIGYATYGYVDWFFLTGIFERQDGQVVSLPVLPPDVIRRHLPQPLSIGTVDVLAGGTDRYDLYAEMINPNSETWAEFNFGFYSGDTLLGNVTHGFILPGMTARLSALGVTAPASPSGVSLRLSSMTWRRVDKHVVGQDYPLWLRTRYNPTFENVKYVPPDSTDAAPVGRATFDVINNTAYGYHKIGFFVRLISGGSAVGANYVTISELQAGETRHVEANWVNDIGAVDEVQVEPVLNVFDPSVFIVPRG